MRCFLLTRDLFFSSQLSSSLHTAGHVASTVGTIDPILEQGDGPTPYFVIMDLSLPGLNPQDVVAQLREQKPSPAAILAVGPHVHAEKLTAATAAGCDRVLTKGEASRALGVVLSELELS